MATKMIITIVLAMATLQATARISRKEVKAAKARYRAEQRPVIREFDSLYYVGIWNIRREQVLKFKR